MVEKTVKLKPDEEYQFVVVLKSGQRLIPQKQTEETLQKWLRHPVISFLTATENISFRHEEVDRIEVVEQ